MSNINKLLSESKKLIEKEASKDQLNEFFGWFKSSPIKKGYDDDIDPKTLNLDKSGVKSEGTKLIRKWIGEIKDGNFGIIVHEIKKFYQEETNNWKLNNEVIQHVNNYRILSDYFNENDRPIFVHKRANRHETPVTYLLAGYELLVISSRASQFNPYKGEGDDVFKEIGLIMADSAKFIQHVYDDYGFEFDPKEYKKPLATWSFDAKVRLLGTLVYNMVIAKDLIRVGLAQMTYLNVNAKDIVDNEEKTSYKLVKDIFNSNRRNSIVLGPAGYHLA